MRLRESRVALESFSWRNRLFLFVLIALLRGLAVSIMVLPSDRIVFVLFMVLASLHVLRLSRLNLYHSSYSRHVCVWRRLAKLRRRVVRPSLALALFRLPHSTILVNCILLVCRLIRSKVKISFWGWRWVFWFFKVFFNKGWRWRCFVGTLADLISKFLNCWWFRSDGIGIWRTWVRIRPAFSIRHLNI